MKTQEVRSFVLRLCAFGPFTLAAMLGLLGCVPVGDGADGGTIDDNEVDDTNDHVAGLPLVNFATEDFVGSGNCAACHRALTDSTGSDVSVDAHWRATMMANAARDPYFLASVSSEVERFPALRDTIEDTCANCHMPMAHTQAVVDGAGTLIFNGDGFLSDDHTLHDAAMDGVSCSLCHQIQDTFLTDPEGSFSGGYVIDTDTEAPDRLLFGPYPEPQLPAIMEGAVGFTPVFAEHIGESALCATCHTLFTPTLDAQGEIVGTFPEQTPFLEWQHSEYGDGVGEDRSCQDCHMPVADGSAAISSVPSGLEAREPFYQHQFLGGNVFMLGLLGDNIEELALTSSTSDFNAAIARTTDYLQNETADLAIIDAQLDGDTLSATLEVTNKAGHKFPTGFPSRRAWIHLTVTDGDGTVIFESGSLQADGSVIGDDADVSPTTFERHHDVITGADQVQIYQTIMQNTDGEVTYTLLRAAAYAKDNRLLPSGFDKGIAGADIAVYGRAATDSNFQDGSDWITYQIDVAGHNGPFTVTAGLLFQSVSYRFAIDLEEEHTPATDQFTDLYNAADRTPTVAATAETVIP